MKDMTPSSFKNSSELPHKNAPETRKVGKTETGQGEGNRARKKNNHGGGQSPDHDLEQSRSLWGGRKSKELERGKNTRGAHADDSEKGNCKTSATVFDTSRLPHHKGKKDKKIGAFY